MVKKGVVSFVLLLASCWCASSDNPSCDPKVYGGASFSELVMQQECDVDEKLLKLFTDKDSFKTMLDKVASNVMCIGFIEAFNMTSKDSCTYDYLAHIPSEDFCKNSKALDVLVQANDSSVFDEHYRVVEVVNFVFQHCDYMCNDSTGSNQLCWSFGEVVKFVMKHHVTTPPTITNTSLSSDIPATTQSTVPSWLGGTTKKASHEEDSDSTTAHDGDSGIDGTNVGSVDKNSTSTTGAESTSNKPKLLNTLSGGVKSSPSPDFKLLFHENISTPSSSSSTNAPPPDVPIKLMDKQHINVDTNKDPNISDSPGEHTDSPGEHTDSPGEQTDIPGENTDSPGEHTGSPGGHPHLDTLDQHPNTSSNPETSDPDGDNVDAISDQGNLPPESSGDMIRVDEQSHLEQNLQENGDKDQTAVSSDGGKSGTGNADSKDGGSYEYDDDDDDDGYSYWHFAAVLLFILFLGVATYLATLNRKKVCRVCGCVRALCVYVRACIVCMRACNVCMRVCVCCLCMYVRVCVLCYSNTNQKIL